MLPLPPHAAHNAIVATTNYITGAVLQSLGDHPAGERVAPVALSSIEIKRPSDVQHPCGVCGRNRVLVHSAVADPEWTPRCRVFQWLDWSAVKHLHLAMGSG